MSSTQMDWRALCGELSDALAAHHPGHVDDQELIDRTRAELAYSEPKVGPTRLRTERRTGPFGEWTALVPCGRPAPVPAGEVAELAAEIRHFLNGYRQIRGLDPEHIYSIHRGDAMEARITVSGLTRAADLLERQAAPVPVAVSERLPELRGMFERILCVARSSDQRPVGNIELADRLIKAVVSWGVLPLPSGEVEK